MLKRITKQIHSVLLEFLWVLAERRAGKLPEKSAGFRFLVLSGGGLRLSEPKSFGEEMMFIAICLHIRQTAPGASITVLRYEGSAGEDYDFYGHRIKEIAFPSKSYTSLSSYREFRKLATGFSDVYLMGADCLDGAYWRRQTIQMLRFMTLAGIVGCRGRILGFSYNGNKDAVIRRELKRSSSYCMLCVRDSVSKERLESFVFKNLKLVSDLAFLTDAGQYPVPDSDSAAHQKLEAWKKEGAIIVAVNICGWHWKDPEAYLNRFGDALVRLAQSNPAIRYLLLPHDDREGKMSDVYTLSLLRDKLYACRERTLYCGQLRSGIQAKQLVRHAGVVVTGRMHLAIAALSQGIPVISLMYQGKFEGLYAHYYLEGTYCFDPGDLKNIMEALKRTLIEREAIALHIQSRNTEIFRLAEMNF